MILQFPRDWSWGGDTPEAQSRGTLPAPAPALTGPPLTLSELFFSCTNLPSRSISSMLTLPEAEACWASWKLLLPPPPAPTRLDPVPSGSSASSRLRLLRPERPAGDMLLPLLEVAREMVTRDDGLGDSFSLGGRGMW